MESPQDKNTQSMGANLARLHDGMSLLVEQKWHSDVNIFREAFAHKMDPLIGVDRTGWAHFEYLYVEPVSSEVRTKEVLLIKMTSNGARSSKLGCPPLIKVITNEMFSYRGEKHCLSEDILVDDDGDALYHLDVCILEGESAEESLLELSYAQPFIVPTDDKVLFTDFQLVPPRMDISLGGEDILVPFGLYDSRIDGNYALGKAWEIVGQVWEENPRHIGLS